MTNAGSAYRFCDKATEYLLYFMIIFSPWAFGTTQFWAIWTMNIGGALVGLLFFAKRFAHKKENSVANNRFGRIIHYSLAILTLLILAFCLISALNARATADPDGAYFTYFDCIDWLPHTYDRAATWATFWRYLSLALLFWGANDWLSNKDPEERKRPVPTRLRKLLWVLCINGALVALEGLLQRASGTPKLLWLVEPRYPVSPFGPFAYRANASQFFNLIWPVALGLWWALYRGGSRRKTNNLLLPCIFLMATSALISLSRGGAIIALACAVASTAVLIFAQREASWTFRLGMAGLMTGVLVFAAFINGDKLTQRFKENPNDNLSGRSLIYDNAKKIAADFPIFGSGPGSFANVTRLYLSPGQKWYTEVHDDWLETRVTFGWVGFILILAALATVIAHWFFAGGIYMHWSYIAFFWIALGGCLVHARFDFPMQVHSILFVFVLECSIIFSLARKK